MLVVHDDGQTEMIDLEAAVVFDVHELLELEDSWQYAMCLVWLAIRPDQGRARAQEAVRVRRGGGASTIASTVVWISSYAPTAAPSNREQLIEDIAELEHVKGISALSEAERGKDAAFVRRGDWLDAFVKAINGLHRTKSSFRDR
jgi:hypothetical protein